MENAELEPDPGQVFNGHDLADQLNRLRRAAARQNGRRPSSLNQLAERTRIPRSTLHTYLTGAALPPPAALDTIVLALGGDRTETRSWAAALERIADLQHASGSRTAVTATSRFYRLDAEIRRRLTDPGDQWYDQVDLLSLTQHVTIGRNRQMTRFRIEVVVRARTSGVDRYVMRLVPDPCYDLDRLEVIDFDNCTPGHHRTFADIGIRVINLRLSHALAAGESAVLSATIDYAGALRPTSDPRTETAETLHGFRRRGNMFALVVRFTGPELPYDLRQVHVAFPDAPENRIATLHLDPTHATTIAVPEPTAGLHGIRWQWPAHRPIGADRSATPPTIPS